jgi:thioesterase domain-containing protein
VWREVVQGGLTVEGLPGDHAGMLGEPTLGRLARLMSAGLSGRQ